MGYKICSNISAVDRNKFEFYRSWRVYKRIWKELVPKSGRADSLQIDDDLYDYIEDAIAIFAEANPQIIVYETKDFIYR